MKKKKIINIVNLDSYGMAVTNGATGPKSSISAPTSATIPENIAGKTKQKNHQNNGRL